MRRRRRHWRRWRHGRRVEIRALLRRGAFEVVHLDDLVGRPQVAPDLGRQVVCLVDGVVVEHAAERAHLVIEKGLFAFGALVRPLGGERVRID